MKKFYIGKRHNPQLSKPYFVAFGQLTAKEAKGKEKSLYGSMSLSAFSSEQEYSAELKRIEGEGFRVNQR